MQVSEAASAALTLQAITYICEVKTKADDDDQDLLANEFARFQLLEKQGIMIGLKLTERLLHREPFFSGKLTDIACYVGYTLWKVIFGKKIDSIKVLDHVYHLSDNDFKWLQGFPRLKDVDRVQTLASSLEDETVKEQPSGGQSGSVRHKDVLIYATGIIKGATYSLIKGNNLTVSGTHTKDGETFFLLDFRL